MPISMRVPVKNPWAGLRGLPRTVWIVAATSLINRAGMMALPFLVLYLTRHIGTSAALAGLAVSAYGLGGIVTGPIAGRLCDRLGPFTVMRASLALTGVILMVIPLAHSFSVVVLLVFVWALIADATRPATMSALSSAAAPEQRKAAIALNRLGVNLGMSIGPAVGGFLALVSFPLLFVVDVLTSLAAAVVLSLLLRPDDVRLVARASNPDRDEDPRASPVHPSTSPPVHHGVWRDRTALTFLLAMVLVGLVFTQTQGAMSVYLVRDLHYRESFFGSLFVVNTLMIVALEVPLNLAMAHWPHRRALILGMLLTGIGFGAMGMAKAVGPLVATVVIWTFGEMITFPVGTAYLADLAPRGRMGEYMGAYSSTFSLSVIIGPWAGTAVLDRFGSAATWAGVFVCGLFAAAVTALTHPQAADEPALDLVSSS
ncbi:MAG TPA: MFS transporter [Gemmatimonadaceae bacterium]